jgi:hypothetical protein
MANISSVLLQFEHIRTSNKAAGGYINPNTQTDPMHRKHVVNTQCINTYCLHSDIRHVVCIIRDTNPQQGQTVKLTARQKTRNSIIDYVGKKVAYECERCM